MAQSENQTYPWFASAGLRRGKLRGASDIRLSPDDGQRNAMQTGGNSVNPIVKFIKEGIHFYGQKTLLRSSSALNRENVRRLLLFLERGILEAARQIVFEPGDEATDREFIRLATPVLEFAQDNRGLREFLVLAASTDTDRDNQKLVFQIFIKPTKAAEVIEVQFILTSQTANFAELIAG
jgi:phage tail sheath protein FI